MLRKMDPAVCDNNGKLILENYLVNAMTIVQQEAVPRLISRSICALSITDKEELKNSIHTIYPALSIIAGEHGYEEKDFRIRLGSLETKEKQTQLQNSITASVKKLSINIAHDKKHKSLFFYYDKNAHYLKNIFSYLEKASIDLNHFTQSVDDNKKIIMVTYNGEMSIQKYNYLRKLFEKNNDCIIYSDAHLKNTYRVTVDNTNIVNLALKLSIYEIERLGYIEEAKIFENKGKRTKASFVFSTKEPLSEKETAYLHSYLVDMLQTTEKNNKKDRKIEVTIEKQK